MHTINPLSVRFTPIIKRLGSAFVGLAACVALYAQTDIYWTGGGDGVSWSDEDNWDLKRVPGTDDIVWLGAAVDGDNQAIASGAQNIQLNSDTTITSLMLAGAGDRTVNLTGTGILSHSGGVFMEATATAAASVLVDMAGIGSYRELRNNSTTAELVVGYHNGSRSFYGAGTIRWTDQQIGIGRFYGDEGGTFIGEVSGANWINQAVQFYDSPNLYWKQSGNLVRVWSGDATFHILDTNDDVLVRNGYSIGGLATQRITMAENAPGVEGTFIIQPREFNANSLELVTSANTIVQFERNEERGMNYAPNAGISGAGSFWQSAGTVRPIEREMTYTGRTMLSGGTLQLNEVEVNEVTYRGALPTGTIVELGAGAALDLNGLDQTIGGLTDWTGRFHDLSPTSGEILLNGATLTIHAESATTFSAPNNIIGEGTLVKSGEATFTLDGNYEHPDNRTLRLEGGVLNITGEVDLSEGVFQLAGGRLHAGDLIASDVDWQVTLAFANVCSLAPF